jgi:serine/threonine protein kinase
MDEIEPQKLGAYQIEEEIGRGGLGIVYRARHRLLDRVVALKVLHPHRTSSREFAARFRDEGRAMAVLEHPNILRVYDAGEAEGQLFLAMAYLDGRTLATWLRSAVAQEWALQVTYQLAGALAYAHSRGVIHRDVKPANIMIGPDGHVTLMDFVVARLRDAPGMTLPGVRIGTPYYMAPEQIAGGPVDARCDLYALGVVLHEMLSGSVPFSGPDSEEIYQRHIHDRPPPLPSACPQWLQQVVERALAKSPEDRFADAAEFLQALGARAALAEVVDPAGGGNTRPGGSSQMAAADSGPSQARELRTAGSPPADRTVITLLVNHAGIEERVEFCGDVLIGRTDQGIGSVADVDLRHDDTVSRRHARLILRGGGYFLRDLGSQNGTALNGTVLTPSQEVRLKQTDVIEVGDGSSLQVLRIQPAGNPG